MTCALAKPYAGESWPSGAVWRPYASAMLRASRARYSGDPGAGPAPAAAAAETKAGAAARRAATRTASRTVPGRRMRAPCATADGGARLGQRGAPAPVTDSRQDGRVPAELEKYRSYWDTDAATYDKAAGHAPRDPVEIAAWTAAMAAALPARPARVLDVGAGTGFLSLLAARLGHEVVALDLSSEMLDRLAAKAVA